jgi:hypothetical protein
VRLHPLGVDGPLIWVRSVSGGDLHGLAPLLHDAEEGEVHRRVGGYWPLGVATPASRGGRIRQALD